MQKVYTYLTDKDYKKFRKKCDKLGVKPQQLTFLLMAKMLGYDTRDRETLLLDWEIETREESMQKKKLGIGEGLVDRLVRQLKAESPQSTTMLSSSLRKNDRMVYRTLWENPDVFEKVPEPPQARKGKRGRGRRPKWWALAE